MAKKNNDALADILGSYKKQEPKKAESEKPAPKKAESKKPETKTKQMTVIHEAVPPVTAPKGDSLEEWKRMVILAVEKLIDEAIETMAVA